MARFERRRSDLTGERGVRLFAWPCTNPDPSTQLVCKEIPALRRTSIRSSRFGMEIRRSDVYIYVMAGGRVVRSEANPLSRHSANRPIPARFSYAKTLEGN